MNREAVLMRGGQSRLGNPKAILLIQLGDIGDVVLSTPCIRALRDNFPGARLVVMVRKKAVELLMDCPWVDEVVAVRRARGGVLGEMTGQVGFVHNLRAQGFDLTIDLRTGTRGAILARLSGAGRRIGFFAEKKPWWRNRLFTDLLRYPYNPGVPVKEYLLVLLEAFGVKASRRDPELVVSPARQAEADRLLSGIVPGRGPLVVVQPFSLWQYKEWGVQKYVALIRWLVLSCQATVLITGGAAERRRAEAIVGDCQTGCHNLAGRTSLALYAALLRRCRLFIGVDSAGLHIAAAVGTPTVSLFGPSSPVSWAPCGLHHKVVRMEYPCLPCRQKGCDGSGHSRCLDELSVEQVQRAVAAQLEAVLSICP